MKIRVGDIEMNCRDEGTGRTVVLVHAFPLNSRMWDAQVAALSSEFRVIAPDLRGFGLTGAGSGPQSIEEMAADIRGLLDELGLSRVTLVGLSMGGYVSMAFYRRYPEALNALVLADTRGGADTDEGRQRRLLSALKVERDGVAAIVDDMISVLLGKTTRETRPDVVGRVRKLISENSPGGVAAAQRAMADRLDSTELLGSVKIPVLLIVGEEDTLSPPAEFRALHAIIPGAELRIIDGAGHLSNLESPQEFNAALLQFLRSF
jgi:pimeloyl-ACP methyl ester carboxylesterase